MELISDILIEHKNKCAKEGKYVEARLVDTRILELKDHLKFVRGQILGKKHDDEVLK